MKLTIHKDFFPELAERLWRSPVEAVRELLENSYDADATKVLITLLIPDGLAIEDDGGMDETRLSKFLQVGGRHDETEERTAGGRKVVGKYRVGRLSALGYFGKMRVRTKLGEFHTSFTFSYEDLLRLSQGEVEVVEAGEPPLGRNGTEIVLTGPKSPISYEELAKALSQLPILRTPGFEVYIKQCEVFVPWSFDGSQRIYPKEIPGVKIQVKLDGIDGVITIADDSALPLADEDRGIGVVVSGHLVTRSMFGLEGSSYRLDRVTGYVECDRLKTTFGAKDRLIEDEEYRAFWEKMRRFVSDVLLPKLAEAEVRFVGRMELKVVRKVDRILGDVLAEAPIKLFEVQKVDPSVLRSLLKKETILKQSREATTVVLPEPGAEERGTPPSPSPSPSAPPSPPLPPLPLSSPSTSSSPPLQPSASQPQPQPPQGLPQPQEKGEPSILLAASPSRQEQLERKEAVWEPTPALQTPLQPQPQVPPLPPSASIQASEPKAPRARVGHFLHDLGVVVLFYDDPNDPRPCYHIRDYMLQGMALKAIFVNRKHPAYEKHAGEGGGQGRGRRGKGEQLVQYLLRLLTNEVVALGREESEEAISEANSIYGLAATKA